MPAGGHHHRSSPVELSHHLAEFERFVCLAAVRVGQVLNLQSLAADTGVSGHTAREWITLLEASYIVFRLPPWFANIGERPELYFFRDSAGNEADLVLEHGATLMLVEIKSARSVAPDAMRAVAAVRRSLGARATWSALVYDGIEAQRRSDFDVVPCLELRRWLTGG